MLDLLTGELKLTENEGSVVDVVVVVVVVVVTTLRIQISDMMRSVSLMLQLMRHSHVPLVMPVIERFVFVLFSVDALVPFIVPLNKAEQL